MISPVSDGGEHDGLLAPFVYSRLQTALPTVVPGRGEPGDEGPKGSHSPVDDNAEMWPGSPSGHLTRLDDGGSRDPVSIAAI
jgi:hypothetical protein